MDKKLFIGNGAVARGLWEAGCRFISSYPGTPSTEITEVAAEYPEIYAEWAPNEKVAVESAIGASLAGARAFSAMKHVGLNVAADPVFTVSYSGVNGGLVIAVADDQGMHSSQNEQDSRNYAKASKIPMLEPADSADCRAFAMAAYEISEKFDTPVFLRLTTRVAHSQGLVECGERSEPACKGFDKNPRKYVMNPGNAKARRVVVAEREKALDEFVETTPLNRVEYFDKKIGVIAAGVAYEYAREAFGERASYLKLGIVYPLPSALIREFAANVDELIIVEELDGFIEQHVRALGVKCRGKELFTYIGEYSANMLRERVLGEKPEAAAPAAAPARPPVLCPGCPHRGVFYVLHKLGVNVCGDIGCYTLGAADPLTAMDTTICMGASIGIAHGMDKIDSSLSRKTVAVIGDSTFMHSGLTGLLNVVYNGSTATVMILDNSITAMTGHQQNPATALTLKGDPAPALDLAGVCRALGVKRVREVDPFDLAAVESALKEELAAEEPSVIVAKRPCALLKTVERKPPLVIDAAKCVKCKQCLKLGCPAISLAAESMVIDHTLCTGCGLCEKVCKPGAIVRR